MAKKKRKKSKKRRPPQSRPATQSREPGSGAAAGAAPPAGAEAAVSRPTPPPARQSSRGRPAPGRRREALERQRRRRYALIAASLVLAVAGIGVFQWLNGRREADRYRKLSAAAGCGEVREVGNLARDHVNTRVVYATSPPVGGAHDPNPLPKGVYTEPFSDDPAQRPSIYQAVHSLEHGYIVVWHDGLPAADVRALEGVIRQEAKTILVPYPQLSGDTKIALTAWGRLQTCERADADVLREFIDLYRQKTAPEPNSA